MKHWQYSDYSSFVSTHRVVLQRIFYSLVLIILGLNFSNHLLLSQIGPNPIVEQGLDPAYLFFMVSGLSRFISGWPAPYFDLLLILSCIASISWPRKGFFPLIFLVLYYVNFIVYNMMSGHHYTNIGLLIMAIPFVFVKPPRFVTAFACCRFLFCFMMFSAACWKIARGNLWHFDQTYMLLLTTHLELLVANNNDFGTYILKWLLSHKYAAHTIWIMLIIIEVIFIAGFLNFKSDKLLLLAYLLFFIGGWVIFRIYNFENLLFLITLTPVLNIIGRFSAIKPTAATIIKSQ